jgi:hypothetical protein
MHPVKNWRDEISELMRQRKAGRMEAVGLGEYGRNAVDDKDTPVQEAKEGC